MITLPILLALAAGAADAVPAPERPNALAFDNGTVLVSDGGSYSPGIRSWSAWHLTDGDEGSGWCSPQGKPTGLAFVWELDTTWRLDTLAVSTRHLQERGYPGISAKTVELLVGDGTAFKAVGTFEIGKEERKEFSLPGGTVARQVKLVVTSNHGNAKFTEIAEVELLGARTGTVARPSFAGDFGTRYGPMRFVQEGDDIFGCYDWTAGAQISGNLAGRNARVTWTEYPDGRVRQGTATFSLHSDGAKLWGVWYENGKLAGEWVGTRVGAGKGPKCTPQRKGQLEALKRSRRMVLYGVRFDSNSDVPRPESDPTLDQLASMLGQDASLRLLVEGHTDATNTDAFNLDLSQRRAQSVVAALVKRGVKAERLQPKGFGRSKPVADNATAQGRALNRRVEVSILE